MRPWTTYATPPKHADLTAVQLQRRREPRNSAGRFSGNSRNEVPHGPVIFRCYPAKIFDAPGEQTVGWDPVAAGLVEPDEAYKGKRVHKIHVAKNGDLFLETHGFRPGVISGVLLDSSTAEKRGGTGQNLRLGTRPALGRNHQQHQQADRRRRPASRQCAGGDPPSPSLGRGRFHRRRTRTRQKRSRKVRAFVEAVRAMEEAS